VKWDMERDVRSKQNFKMHSDAFFHTNLSSKLTNLGWAFTCMD